MCLHLQDGARRMADCTYVPHVRAVLGDGLCRGLIAMHLGSTCFGFKVSTKLDARVMLVSALTIALSAADSGWLGRDCKLTSSNGMVHRKIRRRRGLTNTCRSRLLQHHSALESS